MEKASGISWGAERIVRKPDQKAWTPGEEGELALSILKYQFGDLKICGSNRKYVDDRRFRNRKFY